MEYLVLYLVCLIISAIRMEVMYKILIKAICDENNNIYDNLPSYFTMVFNPIQWHMWTYKQYSKRYNNE